MGVFFKIKRYIKCKRAFKKAMNGIKEYHRQEDLKLIERMEALLKPGDEVKVSPGLCVQLRGHIGIVSSVNKESVSIDFGISELNNQSNIIDKQTINIPIDKIKHFVTAVC